MTDYAHMNQGNMKLQGKDKVFKINPDKDKGTRKVQINKNTWIYTKCKTDQEAIEKFNKLHKLHDERHGI